MRGISFTLPAPRGAIFIDVARPVCSDGPVKIDGPNKPKHSRSAQTPAGGQGKPGTPGETESPVNFRHLLVLLGAGLLLLAVISLTLESYWKRQQPVFHDMTKLVTALRAFSRDQFIHGKGLPSTISLNDLVTAGYLSPEDVREFDGIELTFSNSAINSATNEGAQQVMIHARLPDGTVLALLADGSVQQVKK